MVYVRISADGKKGLTIEGIDYVNIDGKLQTNDDRLLTTSKDIVGAINELFNLEPEGVITGYILRTGYQFPNRLPMRVIYCFPIFIRLGSAILDGKSRGSF